MFKPRVYTNQTADWGYQNMLGSYNLGHVSMEQMAEYAVLCDEIEAEHLAKQAKMDAKNQRKPAKATKNIAA